jgi:hypothetical protein
MPTPFRTALGQALATRLAVVFTGYTIERATRTDVTPERLPTLRILTGEAEPDHTLSPGEVMRAVQFTITGHIAPQATDVAAEDALAALEAAISDTLDGQPLLLPGGALLTDDVQLGPSSIQLIPAERADQALGDVTVSFTAKLWRPLGDASFP